MEAERKRTEVGWNLERKMEREKSGGGGRGGVREGKSGKELEGLVKEGMICKCERKFLGRTDRHGDGRKLLNMMVKGNVKYEERRGEKE